MLGKRGWGFREGRGAQFYDSSKAAAASADCEVTWPLLLYKQWFFKCNPHISSSTWELVRDADSQAPPRPTESESLGGGSNLCSQAIEGMEQGRLGTTAVELVWFFTF